LGIHVLVFEELLVTKQINQRFGIHRKKRDAFSRFWEMIGPTEGDTTNLRYFLEEHLVENICLKETERQWDHF
jgi:hypothetical protein